MWIQSFLLMLPLIVVFGLLSALTLYVFVQTDNRYKLKFALIPVLLAGALFSFVFLAQTLGYAYPTQLPDRSEYLAHTVVASPDNMRKVWIDVLIKEPRHTDSRLIRIPWSKPAEQVMQQAQQQKRAGQTVMLERKNRHEQQAESHQHQGLDGDEYPFMTRDMPMSEIMPKDPEQ